jgi:hypothetical protein
MERQLDVWEKYISLTCSMGCKRDHNDLQKKKKEDHTGLGAHGKVNEESKSPNLTFSSFLLHHSFIALSLSLSLSLSIYIYIYIYIYIFLLTENRKAMNLVNRAIQVAVVNHQALLAMIFIQSAYAGIYGLSIQGCCQRWFEPSGVQRL